MPMCRNCGRSARGRSARWGKCRRCYRPALKRIKAGLRAAWVRRNERRVKPVPVKPVKLNPNLHWFCRGCDEQLVSGVTLPAHAWCRACAEQRAKVARVAARVNAKADADPAYTCGLPRGADRAGY